MGSICNGYMCILLYVRLMGVMVYHGSMVNWQGVSICHGYMCILLYVRLIGCNSVAWIYGHLVGGEGQSAMGICAFH